MHALLNLLCSLIVLLPGGVRMERHDTRSTRAAIAATPVPQTPSAIDFNLLDLDHEDFAIAETEAETDEETDDSLGTSCDVASSLIPPDLSPVASGRSWAMSRESRAGLHPLRLSVQLRF